jgi:hypothetical protein
MNKEDGDVIEACANVLIFAVAFWGLVVWWVML